MAKNIFSWIEVPVSDFDRAKKFYETIFGYSLEIMEFTGYKMGLFPGYDSNAVSGSIVHGEGYTPTGTGAIVYFNANPDLTEALNRVKDAGGDILMEKKQISEENGYMALIRDTEGNKVALHSDN